MTKFTKEQIMLSMSSNSHVPAYMAEFYNFDAVGKPEIENIKTAKEEQNHQNFERVKKDKDGKIQGFIRDIAAQELTAHQREELERIYDVNGRQFTGYDLQETISEILNDKQAFADKHNLSDEDADIAFFHAQEMRNMSPKEQADYLKKLGKTHPRIAQAVADNAQELGLERQGALSKPETYNQSKQVDDMLSDRPTSKITQTFTQEVANYGANAKSFKSASDSKNVDIKQVVEHSATQYDHTEKPFVLDM